MRPMHTFWRSRIAIAFSIFAVVAAFFLFTEHRAHLLGALPYLLLIACPVMHMFMHGGHKHGAPPHNAREANPHE